MTILYHPDLDITREVTDRSAVHMKEYGWEDAPVETEPGSKATPTAKGRGKDEWDSLKGAE